MDTRESATAKQPLRRTKAASSLLEDISSDEEPNSPKNESELIYRAVMNTVNKIWEEHGHKENNTDLLNKVEIKSFLKDFLSDQEIEESDLDLIILNMNTDRNGQIDKYEMTSFLLMLTGYEKHIKPKEFAKRECYSKSKSAKF